MIVLLFVVTVSTYDAFIQRHPKFVRDQALHQANLGSLQCSQDPLVAFEEPLHREGRGEEKVNVGKV